MPRGGSAKKQKKSTKLVLDRRFILPPRAQLEPQPVSTDILSVASFNLLADSLHRPSAQSMTGGGGGGGGGVSDADHFDLWVNRWPVLEQQLQTLTADIVCLQEVDEKHFYKHLMPFFASRDYAGELQESGHRVWGNATFWVSHAVRCCAHSF